MRARAIGALLLLIAASACGSRSLQLELGLVEPELSFLVASNAGVELRPLGPVHATNSLTLERDESLLYWIGLSSEALAEIAPGYQSSRREEAEVFLGPDSSRSLDPFGDQLVLDIPAQAELLEIEADSGRAVHKSLDQLPAFSALWLRLPSNPDFCDPDPSAKLVPYGASGEITVTSTAVTNPEMVDIAPLDDHHLLVLGADVMFVLEEGGEMPKAKPGQRSPLLAGPDLAPPTYARWLAVDPTPRPDGSKTVWVVGWWELAGVLVGSLQEFSVSVEGIVRLPDPVFAPELPALLPALNSVSVAPDGTVLVVGAMGLVLVRAPGDALFRRSADAGAFLSLTANSAVFAGPERGAPTALVALGGFSVAEGDPAAGHWTTIDVAPEIGPLFFPSRDVHGIVRAPDGEIWVAADQGVVARSNAAGVWKGVDPGLPPSLRGCNGDTLRKSHSSLSGIAVDQRQVFLAVVNCSVIFRIDRARSCLSALRGPEGEDASPIDRYRRVRVFGDRVFALGGKLGIYVSAVP